MIKSLYIFDIDGTLADCANRLHWIEEEPKDYKTFYAMCTYDTPIVDMLELARTLQASGADIWYFTGRSEECRDRTTMWLRRHGLYPKSEELMMRPTGCYDKDDVLKEDMYRAMFDDDKDRITCVFEDRQRVVDMWRSCGVRCLQVSSGNY